MTSLRSKLVLITDIKIIIINAKKVKIKCFVKKNKDLYLFFRLQGMRLMKKEKNKPKKKQYKKT